MLTDFEGALLARRTAEATRGNEDAAYDLGVAYSTGTAGATLDLIEAHKWFNLAAVAGLEEAQDARSAVASELTAREISRAQAAARAWLGTMQQGTA